MEIRRQGSENVIASCDTSIQTGLDHSTNQILAEKASKQRLTTITVEHDFKWLVSEPLIKHP